MASNLDIWHKASGRKFHGGVYSREPLSLILRLSPLIGSLCSGVWFWDIRSLRTTRRTLRLCSIRSRHLVAHAGVVDAGVPTAKTQPPPLKSQERKNNTFVTFQAVERFMVKLRISKRTYVGTQVNARSCATGCFAERVLRALTSCRDTCAHTQERSALPVRTVANALCAATTWPSTWRRTRAKGAEYHTESSVKWKGKIREIIETLFSGFQYNSSVFSVAYSSPIRMIWQMRHRIIGKKEIQLLATNFAVLYLFSGPRTDLLLVITIVNRHIWKLLLNKSLCIL